MNQYVTGAVIKSLREQKKITQLQLAEKLGVVVVAEFLGEYRQSVVGKIIFQRVRYRVVARHVGSVVSERNIAFLDVRIDVGAHLVVLAR